MATVTFNPGGALTSTAISPSLDNTYILGSSSKRWQTIDANVMYTNTLSTRGSSISMTDPTNSIASFAVTGTTINADVSFSPAATRSLSIARSTGTDTGYTFTVSGGAATSGLTDGNGGDIVLAAGTTTGTGHSRVRLQTYTAATASGTSDNSVIDRLIINSAKSLTNGVATSIATITMSLNSMSGALMFYTITATSGTHFQVYTASLSMVFINRLGTYTYQLVESGSSSQATSGTITVAWTVDTSGGSPLLQLTVTSSLVMSTGYPRIHYTLYNNSDKTVTLS